ncbi:DUF4942 domain-containing protein [Photobacterium kishitanii]|uniref:DUF4942 domain-containing protein n=1 Tax=Photobacterium kishitanii TaxID=318456 RepID=A0A2T3KLN5_9GAMM|nr:DUF4942 domain-containing protein [Photobacterium kishitanii]PSV00634.1 hypothetical protein C9J27_05715 [Photobacterium kishitanii]
MPYNHPEICHFHFSHTNEKKVFGDKKSTTLSRISEYVAKRNDHVNKIKKIIEAVHLSSDAIQYLYTGAAHQSKNSAGNIYHSQVFCKENTENAIKACDADFWNNILTETNSFEAMPISTKNKWSAQILNLDVPTFDEESIVSTLNDVFSSRINYFAMRVDEVFRALSGEHVTNRPEGFTKRIIIANAVDSSVKNEHINNLRNAIQTLLGKARIGEDVSIKCKGMLTSLQSQTPGKYHLVDGGSLKIKAFLNGNVHIEMTEEIAIDLNQILAAMHPLAIPNKFKEHRKNRTEKNFYLEQSLVPNEVVDLLSSISYYLIGERHSDRPRQIIHWNKRDYSNDANTFIKNMLLDDLNLREIEIYEGAATGYEYSQNINDIKNIFEFILNTRTIPDYKSHQYYPSKENVAQAAIDMLEYDNDELTILEPQAGKGHLARMVKQEHLTCVEISTLNCLFLKALGHKHKVINEDFISFAQKAAQTGKKWDRILTNPPFSKGRAMLHIKASLSLLSKKGVVSAILPSSFRGKQLFEGYHCKWHDKTFSGEFEKTNTSVAIVSIKKLLPSNC